MGTGLRMLPLLSCLAILCAVAPQCSAYDEADQRRALQESTETVSVGIYILSIGEVNSEKGTFDADFYLYLSSDTMTRYYQGSCPRNDQSCPASQSIQAILVNAAKSPSILPIDKFKGNRNTTTQFRIKSSFFYTSDLSQWPFETEVLQIQIEDPRRPSDSLQFGVNKALTDISPSSHSPGWILDSRDETYQQLNASIRQVSYPEGAEFSRYVLDIHIYRPTGNAVIKVVLPPVFILVVQVLSLTITPASAETRISIAGTGLTAAVMFHVQLASATPPTSYLLWSDKLMTAVYGVIVFNGLASIAMLRTKKWHLKDTMARHIFNWSEMIAWFMIPTLAIVLAIDYEAPNVGLEIGLLVAAIFLACITRYLLDRRARSLRKKYTGVDGEQDTISPLMTAQRVDITKEVEIRENVSRKRGSIN